MSDKTWGLTETGSVFHSFKADGAGICRSNLKAGVMFQREGGRTEDAVDRAVAGSPHLFRKCGSCAKREAAFRERAEASMQPVGEYDQVCEGITGYGDAALVLSNGECWQFGEVDGKIHQFNTATGLSECNDGTQKDPTRALFREAGYFLSGVQDYDTQVIEGSVCMGCRDAFKVAVYGASYGDAAPSSECETVVDVDAMRQVDDALAFAMDAGAPADEVEDDECVDADGNVYPEHTEDDECRRCGAELSAELSAEDEDEDGEPDVDGAGRTYAEYHPGSRSKADPFAGGPTPEEARANVVRRFPRGTRVTWTEEDGAARHGTVNGYDIGTVTAAGHYNDGRIYIGVDEDDASAASGRFRRRVFADMLDK